MRVAIGLIFTFIETKMRKRLPFIHLLSLIAAISVSFSAFAVRLSGSYTIDPSAPASTTNFQNFASAVTYLTSAAVRTDGGASNAAPFGVSGPVTFNVAAATYTFTSALIIDTIPGSSSVNTITFTGGTGNASSRVLTGSIASSAVVVINGAMYVSLQNLTVNNLFAGSCTGIGIVGSTINNNGTGCSVKNCVVNLPNTGSTTSYGINVTAQALGYGLTGMRCDSVSIDSNTVNGGYYAISIYGSSNSSFNRNNKARGNTVNQAYYMGFYIVYNYNPVIVSNNTVSMFVSNNYNYGMYIYYNQSSSATPSHEISGNKVFAGNYGIYYYYNTVAATTAPVKMYNNSVITASGSTTGGLYIYNPTTGGPVECIHNTVYSTGSGSTTSAAMYYYGPTVSTNIFKNNIFVSKGLGYPAYFSSNPGNVVNYNTYYNISGTNLLYRTSAFTATTYKTIGAGGDSSFNILPSFAGTGNLHLAGICSPLGVNMQTRVPVDIDGHTRSVTPFIGSDEPTGINNDLAVQAITNFPLPVVPGLQDLSVRVRNAGTTPISSFSISYVLNGAAPVTQTYSGPVLSPCDTISVVFTGPNQVNLLNANALRVYTSSPNGAADGNNLNDTLRTALNTPLSGSYTVGGPTADFTGMQQALSALKCGVSGPVTMHVNPGTYNGPISINDSIPGASSVNQVIFDGGSAATTSITANAPNAAVLIFNECKYVTVTNFTINNTSTLPGTGVAFVGNTYNNNGSSCSIKHSVINLSAPDGSYGYGILVTSNNSGSGMADNKVDSISIDSNVINGGNSHGISIWGNNNTTGSGYNRGHRISGNVINNSSQYGMFVYYNYNAMDVLNNTVNMSLAAPATSTNYGIYFYYNQNSSTSVSTRIIGNKVKDATTYGIYIYYANGVSTSPTKVHNNMIAGGFRHPTNTHYGIYLYGPSTAVNEFYHNSVNMDFPTSSTIYGLYYYGSTVSYFKNNILAITTPGAGGSYPAYFSQAPAGNVVNYNQYYNASSATALYRGSAISNTAFKTSSAGGDSSWFSKPSWMSPTNLHLVDACGLTGVDLTASVPADIDGDVRSTTPRVGADEYNGVVNNLTIEKLIQPIAPITAGTQDLIVRVKNIGNNVISSFNVSYTINGATPVVQAHAVPLNPCDTVTLVFTGSDQITLGSVNQIQVYTDSPNSLPDSDPSNDTVSVSYYTPLNGGYTIGGAGANYPTFADATSALQRAGITGPVTFTVNPGTYNVPVTLNGPIAGSSPINTITFDGVDTTTRKISADAPGTAIFSVKNANYVTVKNLSITNLSTATSTGVALIGNSLDNGGTGFTLKRCAVNIPNSGTTASYGVLVTGAATGTAEVAQQADSVLIDSNIVTGGYYGISISTNGNGNASSNRGHRITSNVLNNTWYYGIRAYYIFNPVQINYNTVNMNPTNVNSYGIYFYYNQYATSTPVTSSTLIGNKVTAGYAGVYFYYHTSTAAYPSKIYNNMISIFGTGYAVYSYTGAAGGAVSEIYHNSISTTNQSANSAFFYYNSTGSATATQIKNNIFTVTGSGSYPAYYSTSPTGNVVNYNLYYNASGGNLGYRGSAFTAANFKTNTTGGDSSFNFRPAEWVSADDMHLKSSCGYQGVNLTASVPTDIDGNLRPITPAIGASEPLGVADNMSVEALLQPSSPAVQGLQDLVVMVRNKGTNSVSSFNVSYSLNGGAPVTLAISTMLNPCDTQRITFTGAEQINLGPVNNITVYVSDPNATIDGDRSNDTLKTLVNTPLNGNYTIGGGGASYPTFAAAVSALNAGGVDGPVTFTVNPGTYNEQVVVAGPVTGLSPVNTVTFDGVNAATRIVSTTTPGGATFSINQLNYITVKNLTITNLAATTCAGFVIVGNTLNNAGTGSTLKRCIVNLPNTGTTTSWAVILTGNSNGTSETNQYADSVTIDSNTVNGGYYGITISTNGTGNSSYNRGHRITSNAVNSYYYGIKVYYIFNPVKINLNTVTMNPGNLNSYGIYFYYNQCAAGTPVTSTTLIGNKVTAGYAGVYFYYHTSTAAYPSKIYNNMISNSGTGYGMYCYTGAAGGAVYEIYHNSFSSSNPSVVAAFYYYNSGSLTATMIKNNIFSSAVVYPAYFNTNPTGNVVNYNAYYNASGGNLGYRGSAFTSANFKTTTAGGDSSYNVLPGFVSATDLHISNACLRGVDLTASVPFDIDGTPRNIPPVVGAHEATGLQRDMSVEGVTYVAPIVAGLQDLTVKLKNNSPVTVTSMNITYVLNGGTPVTYAWTGSLAGCDTFSYVFTGPDQVDLLNGSNAITVYVSLPNGAADQRTSNDTVATTLSMISLVPGTAFSGNGSGGSTTGTYIRVADKPGMAATTAFTAEAWIRLPDVTTNQKIIAKSNVSNGFVLGVQNGGIYPEIWTAATGTGSINFVAGSIPAYTWTHVAVTWESGVGVKAYINGMQVGQALSGTATTMAASASDMTIGVSSWDFGFPTSGMVDEVRTWNIALDSVSIRRNMHRTLPVTQPGLTSYLQFNEGTASRQIIDPVSGAQGIVAGGPLALSTIPVGGDSSMTIEGTMGAYFVNSDITVSFTDPFDNPCDLTITEVPLAPNALPGATHTFGDKYWIIQPFGTPGIYAADLTFNMPAGYLNTTDPSLGLYRRNYYGSGNWVLASTSSAISAGAVSFSLVDTFGQFTIASNGTSPLPVTLLSFGGKRSGSIISLNWKTANEINSRGFEIERAFTGADFKTIGFTKSTGSNKSAVTTYVYDDKTVGSNQAAYYRLKQIDMDGKYAYSPIVFVDGGAATQNDNRIAVYPNPFSSELNIHLTSMAAGNAAVKIVDIAGREIYNATHAMSMGENNINIDAAMLQNGIYFLSVEANGSKQTIRIVK